MTDVNALNGYTQTGTTNNMTTTLSNDTVVTDTLQKAENVQDTAKVAQ